MIELPPGLRALAEYAGERQSMSRDRFLATHAAPVLVIPLSGAPADREAFNTSPLSLPAGPPAGWAVAKLAKRAGDAFPSFIWVGREPKCDVVLPFDGVSKLHAQFILRPGGEMDLLDTGSVNGTFLEGERLQDNTPRRVRDGSRIRMGPLEMTYRTPAGFWEELATWAPQESPG